MPLLNLSRRTARGRLLLISFALVLGLGLGAVDASACTIDNNATARADGRLAARTSTLYNARNARTWAAFAFGGTFSHRSIVVLTEERGVLLGVLPAEAVHHPWRWQLGDGTTAIGWTVRHRYVQTGVYRIIVGAYYPSRKQYFPIDLIRIVVS